MRDRISTYPGRVTLVPVTGLENTYVLTRADEPSDPGTPLSKATFLTDATAAALGLTGDVTPNNAFMKLSAMLSAVSVIYAGAGVPGGGIPAKKGDVYIDTAADPALVFICVKNDGSAEWANVALTTKKLKTEILTASQTWSVPTNISQYDNVQIIVFGGGGGGGKTGGGGGGHRKVWTGKLTAS
ncbi:MAG: hypothetical protein IIU58_01780, partial [Clostridia bacterium]|nr:hypothetical protein [Clostridia bacterium]